MNRLVYKKQNIYLLTALQACGHKVGKYLESITTDYGPLKTLTASGLPKIQVDYE